MLLTILSRDMDVISSSHYEEHTFLTGYLFYEGILILSLKPLILATGVIRASFRLICPIPRNRAPCLRGPRSLGTFFFKLTPAPWLRSAQGLSMERGKSRSLGWSSGQSTAS
uniref:Uncharacterized protein n=1 Tax=Gopherus agassizii TaxID=38772 RepID=A0A452GNG4_9SAUR